MKKIILLTAAIFIAAQCAWAAPESGTQPPSDEKESVYITDQIKLAPHIIHEENPEKYYVINVVYPQIEGDNLSENAVKFNKMIDDVATEQANQFKKYVTEDSIHIKTLPESVRHNTLDVDYDTNVVKPGKEIILSVRMSIEGMQAGRAHPYHQRTVFNFNLTTGKELKLADLFKPNSHYLQVIAAYCKKELAKKLEDKFMIADGTKPIASNYKNWNIEDDSLVISFDEYQVAPYVYGRQEVEIPYAELKKVIGENSVIAPCVKDSASCMPE